MSIASVASPRPRPTLLELLASTRFADRAQLAMCAALEQVLPWEHRYERLLDELGQDA